MRIRDDKVTGRQSPLAFALALAFRASLAATLGALLGHGSRRAISSGNMGCSLSCINSGSSIRSSLQRLTFSIQVHVHLLEGMNQPTAEQRALVTLSATAVARSMVMELATANAAIEGKQIQVHQGAEFHSFRFSHNIVTATPALLTLKLHGHRIMRQDRHSWRRLQLGIQFGSHVL